MLLDDGRSRRSGRSDMLLGQFHTSVDVCRSCGLESHHKTTTATERPCVQGLHNDLEVKSGAVHSLSMCGRWNWVYVDANTRVLTIETRAGTTLSILHRRSDERPHRPL